LYKLKIEIIISLYVSNVRTKTIPQTYEFMVLSIWTSELKKITFF